jgi:N-acyl-D-aspartate/D-glutamate deacylase
VAIGYPRRTEFSPPILFALSRGQNHEAYQAGTPFTTIEQAVRPVTGELADRCRIDAGRLRMGDRADRVIIDPTRYQPDAGSAQGTGGASCCLLTGYTAALPAVVV